MENDFLSSVWPEWKIIKKIGRGSFGVVYEAVRKDSLVESHAAIKVISIPQNESEIDTLRSEGLSMDATRTYLHGIVNDFVSEIQLMESFKGVQNIVSVEDYKVVEKNGEVGWDIYIRMELLTSFNSYISDKRLTESEVIKLGVDLCNALELCEKRNVIHRDIKPDNIFINQFGDFKLGDFGIARKLENVTNGMSQKGTYSYMAPEVEKTNQYDSTVDIYSLGLVLYRLLNNNRMPFLDTERQLLNPEERMLAIRRRMNGEKLPVPCNASAAMSEVILCACNPDPRGRFASATAMKNALMSIANGDSSASKITLQMAESVNNDAQIQEMNRTTSVRRAMSTRISSQKEVNTFGGKKKSKITEIIAVAFAAIFLLGGGVFVVSRLLRNNDSQESDSVESSANVVAENSDRSDSVDNSKNDVYSDFDEEQIAEDIEEAEALAIDENYEGALTKIKTALVTYPKSEELQAKETEYTAALAAQMKAKTLEEAASLAESDDYVSAIALVKNAQEANGEDDDFINAYNTYCSLYKDETVGIADELASGGDYIGAYQTVSAASVVLGDDEELTEKSKNYEDSFVLGVISNIKDLISSRDYESAEESLSDALAVFPHNQYLIDERVIMNKCMPQSVLAVCPPYEIAIFKLETVSMGGNNYANALLMAPGGEAYFNLGGLYDILEFDAGHVDDSSSGYGATLEIILDGISTKIDLRAQDLPKHYSIELNGASQMIVKEDGDYDIGFAPRYAIANAVLYPNIESIVE